MYEVRSPGRVNLIGEHTDYTGGDALPMATDLQTTLVADPADDVDVYSNTLDSSGQFHPTDFEATGTWLDYVKGVYAVLQEAGYDPGGFHGELGGNLPLGAGLSSSASLELAVLALLDEAYELDVGREEMARLGQRVENEYVGVDCGIMDQFAVALCQANGGLHVDTGTLEYESVSLPSNMQVLVFHTGVDRELKDSAYNERRATVERALERLDRDTSKDVTEADLDRLPDLERQRLGYIRRENQRVSDAATALSAGDLDRFGKILVEAHRDIAEQYEASCPELDFVVDTAVEAGAYGARLTGAGWGGAAIAVVDPDDAGAVARELETAYRERFPDLDPTTFLVEPSPGVSVEQRD